MSRLLDKSYWGQTGRYQLVYNGLHMLIPASGSVEGSDELELLRVVSNLYYDLYNNALMNVEIRLPETKEMMDIFRGLLIEKMGAKQFNLVYQCWVAREKGFYFHEEGDFDDGYFPEWKDAKDWFSERLLLAFEALCDAAIEICATAQAREFADL